MPSGQQFLFAPEKPLVKRLGKKFFRQIPRRAGVYKMRDALGNIVYVGKAKNLRQRLQSYRVANPERLGRRHLRLLQQVTRIDFDLCADETMALQHEAKLIRELKPRFNRAGVWQSKPKFLIWRFTERSLEISVTEIPAAGWERFGPLGAYAPRLKAVLTRLFWLALHPECTLAQLPHGWLQNRLPNVVQLDCPEELRRVRELLLDAFWGESAACQNWLAARLHTTRAIFEQKAIANDLEEFAEFLTEQNRLERKSKQMALL